MHDRDGGQAASRPHSRPLELRLLRSWCLLVVLVHDKCWAPLSRLPRVSHKAPCAYAPDFKAIQLFANTSPQKLVEIVLHHPVFFST